MTFDTSSENMSVDEAAAYLRLSKATLNRLRLTGGGPKYAQAQPGSRVIYRRTELDAWLCQHSRSSTSEVRSHTA